MKTYKVHESGGQLKVTIPSTLAQAMNIKKGDQITWKIDKGYLVLEKVE